MTEGEKLEREIACIIGGSSFPSSTAKNKARAVLAVALERAEDVVNAARIECCVDLRSIAARIRDLLPSPARKE